jgi:hypothetical protein
VRNAKVAEMAFIEKCTTPSGGYRARYRDPLGRQRSKTFRRKADALRFLVDIEADKARGNWIDPRGADMAVATWADEFMRLSRRLSPTTQDTYRRDLDKYVLPRFGAYRLGIDGWADSGGELTGEEVHVSGRSLRQAGRKQRCPTGEQEPGRFGKCEEQPEHFPLQLGERPGLSHGKVAPGR